MNGLSGVPDARGALRVQRFAISRRAVAVRETSTDAVSLDTDLPLAAFQVVMASARAALPFEWKLGSLAKLVRPAVRVRVAGALVEERGRGDARTALVRAKELLEAFLVRPAISIRPARGVAPTASVAVLAAEAVSVRHALDGLARRVAVAVLMQVAIRVLRARVVGAAVKGEHGQAAQSRTQHPNPLHRHTPEQEAGRAATQRRTTEAIVGNARRRAHSIRRAATLVSHWCECVSRALDLRLGLWRNSSRMPNSRTLFLLPRVVFLLSVVCVASCGADTKQGAGSGSGGAIDGGSTGAVGSGGNAGSGGASGSGGTTGSSGPSGSGGTTGSSAGANSGGGGSSGTGAGTGGVAGTGGSGQRALDGGADSGPHQTAARGVVVCDGTTTCTDEACCFNLPPAVPFPPPPPSVGTCSSNACAANDVTISCDGPEDCSSGQSCCRMDSADGTTVLGYSCQTHCASVVMECTGPEQCPKDTVCCETIVESTAATEPTKVSCQKTCAPAGDVVSFVLCHTSNDCPAASPHCRQSGGSPGFRSCVE
jgi:hypothetical protein